jgi:toxin ParE1/3/4
LAESPGSGRLFGFRDPRLARIRSALVRGHLRYLIFYLQLTDGIEIVRVLHGARDVARLFGDRG